MTFTPGGFERSKVLLLGMKYNCSWVIQEMGEYPRTVDVFGHEINEMDFKECSLSSIERT